MRMLGNWIPIPKDSQGIPPTEQPLKGINTPSIKCPLCELEDESVEHLFFSCPTIKDLWNWFFDWCKVNVGQQDSLNQLLFKILDDVKSSKRRKCLEAAM